MSNLENKLIKLCQKMEQEGLKDEARNLKTLVKNKDDSERPLYEATPTEMPGTWAKPDGEIVKTSKD
jgi:hypothetical protein